MISSSRILIQVVNILITFFIYWQRILDLEMGSSHLPLAGYCYLDYR